MNYTSGGNKGVVSERGKGPCPILTSKITGKENIVNKINNDKLDCKFDKLCNKIDFKFDLLISKIDNQIKLLWWIIGVLTTGVVLPAIIYVVKTLFLK